MFDYGEKRGKEVENDELLTVREVAKRLRCDDTTIRRWIAAGSLEAIALPHSGNRKAYRIKKSALERILQPKERTP